ncbi:MAG: NUDIX hydrolase [Rhodobacteraceae bacterium]|nr:NUDIX hydrolase [Paracoccaceae bacterium]
MADDLPDSFPWPGSAERRDRPAYYYTQSAALPYRLQNGAPEVLLITSSSGLKWGIPKGICEPGLSPQDSAAQEALEEAGLTGHVQPEALGTYPVEKWGATCHVTVYPMQVTAMDPDTRWDENHRQRIWLPRAEAARQVTSLQLARLIRAWQPVPAT